MISVEPLDCRNYLDCSEISTEKTYHNHTRLSSLKRVIVVKSSFSLFTSLCPSFLMYSLHSHILLRLQESPSIVNLTGPDTSHVIQGNLFRTNTFVESLKETNKIETSYMSSPFKFMLLELSGEHTIYKK